MYLEQSEQIELSNQSKSQKNKDNIKKIQAWKILFPDIKKIINNDKRLLIQQVRKGIPNQIRQQIWIQFINLPPQPYEHYYGKLNLKQIELDAVRTFLTSMNKNNQIQSLKNILNALGAAIPQLDGYCQGENFIVAMLLLICNEQNSFKIAFHIFQNNHKSLILNKVEGFLQKNYVLDSKHQNILELIEKYYFKFHQKLKNYGYHSLLLPCGWFIAMYCNVLPQSYCLRILQLYLLEGQKILYRVALQIIKQKQKQIKKCNSFQMIIKLLNCYEQFTPQIEQRFFKEMFTIKLSRKQIQELEQKYRKQKDNEKYEKQNI